ncbi:hypothetical protein HZS_1985 [Henneguya salminicola]|nr:hypothetical protein HZS_1985 [Henneguya salminicola]
MNDHCLNAHPNICMFVEVIRNEFEFYEQRCLEIRQNGSSIRYKNKLYIPPASRVSSCLGHFRLFSQHRNNYNRKT